MNDQNKISKTGFHKVKDYFAEFSNVNYETETSSTRISYEEKNRLTENEQRKRFKNIK